jgi:SAM-dependent methyltransferase
MFIGSNPWNLWHPWNLWNDDNSIPMSDLRDRWAAGSTYESFMGRWSRQLAPQFVAWLRVPAGAHWLDVGCGTGAMTNAICAHAVPATVVGCDPAEPLIEYARRHSTDARASFVVDGADDLPRRPDGFGSVTSLLALNFFPDQPGALSEMRTRTITGGFVSACVWDYAEGMQFLRYFWDVAASIDASASALDEGRRFPICRPDALIDLFTSAGLSDVRCERISISTEFGSFDEYWKPFLGGTGPAPAYTSSLDDERRTALARALEEILPRTPTGVIALTARAWAVRGTIRDK